MTTVLFPTTWLTANPIENLKSPLQKYCIIIIISSKIWSSLVYCHAMLWNSVPSIRYQEASQWTGSSTFNLIHSLDPSSSDSTQLLWINQFKHPLPIRAIGTVDAIPECRLREQASASP
ncbi:MAG: hypothetical protein IIB03_09935 [Acidobacteria bacterium]|nr:hypothetical protein [Acidobacteriota bacterium]